MYMWEDLQKLMFWLRERAQSNQLRSWTTSERFKVSKLLAEQGTALGCVSFSYTELHPEYLQMSLYGHICLFPLILPFFILLSLSCNKEIRLHFHNYSGQCQILQEKIHRGKVMLSDIPNDQWKLEITWNRANNSVWENFIYHKCWTSSTLFSGALHSLCKFSLP